jgi:AcrR family transcriptional regulator
MANNTTAAVIQTTAKRLFATYGYEGFSIRTLAKESGVGISSIYHFFQDKDVVLREIYAATNKALGEARSALPPQPSAEQMLEQLIAFQFEHSEDIVYVLKYYLHFRQDFAALPTRTLPPKSVLHVEEVIYKGIDTGEFQLRPDEVPAMAKVLGHTINGYLLEYYPDVPQPQELQEIISAIVSFTKTGLRSL